MFLMLCAVITVQAYAQVDTKDKKTRKHEMAMQIKKELNLSDSQVEQWKAVHKEANEKRKTIMQNGSLSKEQKKEQLKALHEEKQSKVMAILDADQQVTFKDLKEKMKEEWKEKRGKNKED